MATWVLHFLCKEAFKLKEFDSLVLHHMIEENEVEEIEMFPEHQFPDFREADYDQWAAEFKHHLEDLLE
jgi:hypothetical protein